MVKVLIADNHPIVRKGIKSLFKNSTEIDVVGKAATTSELFDFISQERVDVVLLEMDLPEVNGITALRRLKKDFAEVKVIMFSSHSEDVYAVSTLRAGASGYLSKSVATNVIKDAIVKVANGGIYISNVFVTFTRS